MRTEDVDGNVIERVLECLSIITFQYAYRPLWETNSKL
jgi:hypothetical protein